MSRTIKKLTVDWELGEGRSMMPPHLVAETEGDDDDIPFDAFPLTGYAGAALYVRLGAVLYVRFGPACVEWWIGHEEDRTTGQYGTKVPLRDGTAPIFHHVGFSRAEVVMAVTGRNVIDCYRPKGEVGFKGLLVNDELLAAVRRDCPGVEIGIYTRAASGGRIVTKQWQIQNEKPR